VEAWRDLLSREASRDNRAIDLSWLGRDRTALPHNEFRRNHLPRIAEIPVDRSQEISIVPKDDKVESGRHPVRPRAEDAFAAGRDLATIAARYPLLRNTL
jgi:hypothetical protein